MHKVSGASIRSGLRRRINWLLITFSCFRQISGTNCESTSLRKVKRHGSLAISNLTNDPECSETDGGPEHRGALKEMSVRGVVYWGSFHHNQRVPGPD